MKFLKRLSAVAVSVVMMFGITSVNVFAASITQDGLEVSLTTDKETYSKAEKITATLSIKNTNESDVTDIAMETIIPDGYEVADGTKNDKQLDKLASNETAELKVVYAARSNGEVSQDSQISQESQKSEVSTVSQSSETIGTGDTTAQLAIIVPIVACSLVLVIFGIRKKKIKGFLSIAVSISVIGSIISYLPFNANAVKENPKAVSISQAIKVDNKDFTVKADVTYTYVKEEVSQISEISEVSEVSEVSELVKPNNPTETDDYYWDNSEKVISVIKATESDSVLTEQEVIKLLSDRGFDTEMVITNYKMDGTYLEETEINDKSQEKHPLYTMLYGSETELLWNIYVINGVVLAYPVSYNLVSERQTVLLITETDTVTSYDYISNRFYETIPKESAMIVRKVSKIDKKTLDNLTIGGLSKL